MGKKNIENRNNEIKKFWNERAELGYLAGSSDINLKKIEISAISSYIANGMKILDFGCGNGVTAIEIARRFSVQILAIDYAEEMIKAAKQNLDIEYNLQGSLKFEIGDINSLIEIKEKFDLIYTERTIINLQDWSSQKTAIIRLLSLLGENGKYIMCESSQDGLNNINYLRQKIRLMNIFPPWHNRYLRDDEVNTIDVPNIKLERIDNFSSTYYFISRVINAWMAEQEGKEPKYDALINKLGIELPPFGDMAQTKIWVWGKNVIDTHGTISI
jgi:ubiquinone/menaquinone biosynthesis C-methylase UbiE